MLYDRLIITAASEAFGPSVLALLGSINVNWPDHPPVLVYDIGLDSHTLACLQDNNIPVRSVPPFCPHWRKHFAWKPWCWNDAPARSVFWLDAGVVVLKPLDEVFTAIETIGYFIIPNYESLEWEASEKACIGCKVALEFRRDRATCAGGIIGFDKVCKCHEILGEATLVASEEDCIRATNHRHRHDQAIISLLLYRDLDPLLFQDGRIYGGGERRRPPGSVPGQRIWVHGRDLHPEDQQTLAECISISGPPVLPRRRPEPSVSFHEALRYSFMRRWRRVFAPASNAPRIYDGVK
jgi:hypothetical protein